MWSLEGTLGLDWYHRLSFFLSRYSTRCYVLEDIGIYRHIWWWLKSAPMHLLIIHAHFFIAVSKINLKLKSKVWFAYIIHLLLNNITCHASESNVIFTCLYRHIHPSLDTIRTMYTLVIIVNLKLSTTITLCTTY